jgi:cell division septal protein FtsQ
MFLGIRKKYWWFLLSTLTLIGLMVFVHLSPLFAVCETRLTGPFAVKLGDISQDFIRTGENLFRFDRDILAESMLSTGDIENVWLSLSLPDGINVEVNRFEPAALLLSNKLYGLDQYCRLIPYDSAWDDVNLPVLTGISGRRLFRAPDDYRAAEVITALMHIKDEMPELYRRIAEIDFSDDVYVNIYLTTGTDRYLACSRGFASQLVKLDVVDRTVARSDGGCYNLLYDGVVIRQR